MLFLARFLLRNLKGYLIFVIITLIVTVVQVLATLLIPNLGKFIFDKVGSAHTDPSPPFIDILNFFDHVASGHLHSASTVIVFLMIMLIVTGVLIGVFTYIQLFLASYIAQNLTARLREKLFDQLQRLSLDWHGRQKKGDLVQRISGDIANIEKFVTDGLVDLLADILTLGGVVVFLLLAQWQLTLVAIVLIPSLFIMIFLYTRSIKAAAKRASKATGEVAEVAAEDVGAITVLKAFSLEDREAIRFNRYVGKSRKAALQAGGLQAQFTPLVNILVAAGTAVIFGVGGFAVATGNFPIVDIKANPAVTAGTLFLFISYVGYLFQPMKDLSKLANVINSAFAGAERIQEVLDQTPEIVETRVPYNGPQRLKGDIVFDHVVFGYTPEHPILKGINLHIAAGKKVALVGLSGGGKTTLVKLIPRFYELQEGSGTVRIDGIDSRNIPLPVLRRNVSQVLQESVLFEGTILDNIKIGRPEATMEEIVSACKQAHIHETIMGLDDGYNTKVRERGKNFSGGQRQRLAIARAILCDSPILVLDEPTASLDVEAEVEVLRAIDTLVVGRTVLMISHRLTTLGNVDEIIVLKDGRIVEQGNYQELKRKDGVFAGLLKEQNRYNVDYAGGSMIVPRAELDRLVKGQHNPVLQAQKVPGSELAASNGQNNGTNGRRKARIAVEVDGKMLREYELDKPELRVGRMTANDICVPSDRISRLHASISLVNGEWWIEDAQSLNGLTYNGKLIDRHKLTNGDRIYMAPRVVLTYREESAPVAVSSRPFKPESPAPRVPSSPMPLAATVLPLPQARIVIEVDGQVIVTRSLDKERLTVGRQPGNDVQIPSTLVSGQHGTLMKQDGKWLIIDSRSRNGLTYQGQRVERHILSQGDRVYLAPTVVLRFEQI